MMLVLSPWTKLFIMICGAVIVSVTIMIVICFVSPFCLCHRLLPESARLQYEPVGKNEKKQKKKNNLNAKEPAELTKLKSVLLHDYGSPMSSFTPVIIESGSKSPPPTMIHGHRRVYTVDSSYSSMSPTTESGSRPHSPASTLADDDAQSLTSPSSMACSDIPSAMYGTLTVKMQCQSREASSIGHLVIELVEAHNLPGREYQVSTCDPFMKIVLLKLRTRLRRSRSHYMTLTEFQSKTTRKTRNPVFNQMFTVELPKSDLKDCAAKFMAFDQDKYSNPTELGEAIVPLSEIPLQTVMEPHCITVDFQEPKQNNGELLLGLSYLPTSERLSLHVLRAVNLKYENVATNIDNLNLEVRVLLLHNGKVIKKKKTSPVAHTNNPNFGHTLPFDMPLSELHHVVFLVGVAHCTDAVSESDDGSIEKSSRHDCFIGKVLIGSSVSSQAANHWQAMLHCTRQEVTSWHILR